MRVRFEQRHIYTHCGNGLVAINPYASLPELYNDHMMLMYRSRGDQRPHIFGVAEAAHHDLRVFDKSQSIIVTGESGAGKTVLPFVL